MSENKISISEIETGVIFLGLAIAAIYLLPPIIQLLKVPGEILNAPGEVIDKLKANNQAPDNVPAKNEITSLPGISVDTLSSWLDNPVTAKFDGVPIRISANSNAAIIKYINTGDIPGLVYSAANENLGNKNITWLNLEDTVNGNPYGWIRLQDVSTTNSN